MISLEKTTEKQIGNPQNPPSLHLHNGKKSISDKIPLLTDFGPVILLFGANLPSHQGGKTIESRVLRVVMSYNWCWCSKNSRRGLCATQKKNGRMGGVDVVTPSASQRRPSGLCRQTSITNSLSAIPILGCFHVAPLACSAHPGSTVRPASQMPWW